MKYGCLQILVLLGAVVPQSGGSFTISGHEFLPTRTQSSFAQQMTDPTDDAQEAIEKVPGEVEDVAAEVEEEVVKFPEKMKISWETAILISTLWIFLIGCAPILIHVLEWKNLKHTTTGFVLTKTKLALSVTMWLALFGGLYAFTNLIHFQSAHFTHERSLNIVECIYFMSQVITTVGYGDIVPSTPRGQVFVAVYAVFAFLVIAELMTEMMQLVTEAVIEYREETEHTSAVQRPSPVPLLSSIGTFIIVAAIWVCFYHYMPGEEKTWLQGIYMAIITMSTIGLGAITPTTEEGMIFGAFFMLFGAACLANVIVEFSVFTMELSLWERWDKDHLKNYMKEQDYFQWQKIKHQEEHMSEAQFITYTLIENRLASKEQLEGIAEAFRAMSPRKGAVSLDAVKALSGLEVNKGSSSDENEAASDPESFRPIPSDVDAA